MSDTDVDTEDFPDVEVIAETAKAILVRFDEGDEEWVPKSQVHDDSDVWKKGDTGTLTTTAWWAEKAGRVE